VTPEDFLQVTASNLKADGSVVTAVDLRSGPATVGYQGEFRWSWFATKLNLFAVVTTRSEATVDGFSTLISEAIEYAKQTKGRLRGLQTGVAVMPILASASVSPAAMDLVKTRPPKGFAAITMPAIVDLSTGEAHYYEGRLVVGALYTKWLRERLARALGHS
jgi:hypothetical protein